MDTKKIILIIEDDKFLSRALTAKLNTQGYQVECAFNGDEGIEKMVDLRPNIVLLDLIMPLKDGFDVLEEVRSHDEISDIKIVVATNLGQTSDEERCKELGALDYFVKANTPLHEIISKLQAYL